MKSEDEVYDQISVYKEYLAEAIAEREDCCDCYSEELDLVILSLVDKIETLFWVLEQDIPRVSHGLLH